MAAARGPRHRPLRPAVTQALSAAGASLPCCPAPTPSDWRAPPRRCRGPCSGRRRCVCSPRTRPFRGRVRAVAPRFLSSSLARGREWRVERGPVRRRAGSPAAAARDPAAGGLRGVARARGADRKRVRTRLAAQSDRTRGSAERPGGRGGGLGAAVACRVPACAAQSSGLSRGSRHSARAAASWRRGLGAGTAQPQALFGRSQRPHAAL